MKTYFNKEAAVLLCLLIADIAYTAWAVHAMNNARGWDGLLVFAYLLPLGIVAGFTLLAKLAAHLGGKPINWAKALGIGMLGLVAGLMMLAGYVAFGD